MTRRALAPRHFPARVDTQGSVTTYTALCRYTSTDGREFVDPAKPEQTTCGECQSYDRIKNTENWTSAIQMERE